MRDFNQNHIIWFVRDWALKCFFLNKWEALKCILTCVFLFKHYILHLRKLKFWNFKRVKSHEKI